MKAARRLRVQIQQEQLLGGYALGSRRVVLVRPTRQKGAEGLLVVRVDVLVHPRPSVQSAMCVEQCARGRARATPAHRSEMPASHKPVPKPFAREPSACQREAPSRSTDCIWDSCCVAPPIEDPQMRSTVGGPKHKRIPKRVSPNNIANLGPTDLGLRNSRGRDSPGNAKHARGTISRPHPSFKAGQMLGIRSFRLSCRELPNWPDPNQFAPQTRAKVGRCPPNKI